MPKELFEVEKERFDLQNPMLYRLQGIWPKEYIISAVIDGKELSVQIKPQEKVSAVDRFKDLELISGIRVEVEIELPDNLIDYLHEIRIILMDTEPCSIIGFEHTIDELNGSNLKQELFKQEKSCIGGSIASIEINFNFAIAF